MIIYKCRFTGDEMCSDAFKPGPVKDADGNEVPGLMQVQSQKVNKVRRNFIRPNTFLSPTQSLDEQYYSFRVKTTFFVMNEYFHVNNRHS
jgi:hypothetical protein